MLKETVLLVLRHGLSAVGPLLAAKGLVDPGDWSELASQIQIAAGSGMTAVSLAWSFYRKWKRSRT